MVSANQLLQLGLKDMEAYYKLLLNKVDMLELEAADSMIERMSLGQIAGCIRLINEIALDDHSHLPKCQKTLELIINELEIR